MNRAYRTPSLVWLIVSVAVVSTLIAVSTIALLYQHEYQKQLRGMEQEVRGLAGLMESVAQFDLRHSANTHPKGSWGATMSQLEKGLMLRIPGGSFEEIFLGHKLGDQLVVTQIRPGHGFEEVARVPFDGSLAQGLYRALNNESGTGEIIDFYGQPALAAYALVPSLNIALSNHLELDKFQAAYWQTAVWAALLILALTAISATALLAYTRPLQRRLQESESHAATRIAEAPVGFFETDAKGQCIEVNDRWCELAGMTRSEAMGDGWARALHPDDAPRVVAAWRDFVEQQVPFHQELRFLLPDGRVHWVSASAAALKDPDGQISGYTGTNTDITEIKVAQDRLNEAQRLAKVGSWELDLTSNHLIWSDEIFRIFEIDKTKFGASYEAFLNAIHPDDRDAVNQAYTNSLATRAPYEIVHRLLMADGRIKYVRETCESFFDATGKPLRSVGTVQDITELHKIELELLQHRDHLEELVAERTAALKRSSTMLQTVLNTAPLRIFWKDRNLNYMGCNRVFAEDAGKHSPEELIGKSDHDMAWKATADLYRTDDAAVIATGKEKLSFEEPMQLQDGSRIWLSTSKVPLRNENGEIIGVLGTYENITERKQTEQALVVAKNAAEHASRAKSEFLSRMSHELRTPMNAILGFAQILEMEALRPEQTEFVREIHRAGDHLLELINELLDLSRIEAGKMASVLQPVSVQQVTTDAVQMIQPLISEKRITLINHCDERAGVLADSTRLKQILVNLLSNATKYNRVGGRILIACQPTGDDRLRIAVTDTGPGIPPENLSRLFLPFERLGAEYSAIDGTGIGLALSHQLAELMGGTLGLDSTPGEGSTFWIDLPLAPLAEKSATPVRPSAGSATDPRPYKVLYVEDNAANLRVIEAMFRHQPQMQLLTATNGEFGLELARRYRPDAILLDIHLPGMDGYAVFNALKTDHATRDIPVIALSADAMPIDVERGLKAGFVQYLTKPVKVEELINAVNQCLKSDATTLKRH